ncbi:hypothetical protein RUM43_011451 [Polyplax serrata]|uniref:Uncharacterized protein n=1 Tax=Polyplax serrata TaxID=468196 RepID=A0AAN8NM88_POLSC
MQQSRMDEDQVLPDTKDKGHSCRTLSVLFVLGSFLFPLEIGSGSSLQFLQQLSRHVQSIVRTKVLRGIFYLTPRRKDFVWEETKTTEEVSGGGQTVYCLQGNDRRKRGDNKGVQ